LNITKGIFNENLANSTTRGTLKIRRPIAGLTVRVTRLTNTFFIVGKVILTTRRHAFSILEKRKSALSTICN
jgi:hypothetical protein